VQRASLAGEQWSKSHRIANELRCLKAYAALGRAANRMSWSSCSVCGESKQATPLLDEVSCSVAS
jgi:hypothetical protein